MQAAPNVIGGEEVICFATTNLFKGDYRADGLAICKTKLGGYYLFSCNADWIEFADTWHEDVEDALDQAEYHCNGISAFFVYK